MASIFSKIIAGEIPSHKVYEDEVVFVFLDIHPINPGHLLVVPRQEVSHFDELDEDTYLHCMKIAQQLAKKLKRVLQPERVGLVIAGFDVPHVHIHVFPAHKASDIRSSQDMSAEPDNDALAEMAKKLAG